MSGETLRSRDSDAIWLGQEHRSTGAVAPRGMAGGGMGWRESTLYDLPLKLDERVDVDRRCVVR